MLVSCSNIIVKEHINLLVQPQAPFAKGYRIKEYFDYTAFPEWMGTQDLFTGLKQ